MKSNCRNENQKNQKRISWYSKRKKLIHDVLPKISTNENDVCDKTTEDGGLCTIDDANIIHDCS